MQQQQRKMGRKNDEKNHFGRTVDICNEAHYCSNAIEVRSTINATNYFLEFSK